MTARHRLERPRQPRVSKTARETAEIVALLRQLREKMGLVEELSRTTGCYASISICVVGPSSSYAESAPAPN